jgi:hypothetical protein
MKKTIRPFTNRESCTYMADGIEQSARECERDGYHDKAARMFAWAAKVRAEADEPDDPEDAAADARAYGRLL